MTSEERLEYDRQRAEMVRDVLTGGAAEVPVTEDAPELPASIDLSAVGASDGIISSLDDDFEDAAVQYAFTYKEALAARQAATYIAKPAPKRCRRVRRSWDCHSEIARFLRYSLVRKRLCIEHYAFSIITPAKLVKINHSLQIHFVKSHSKKNQQSLKIKQLCIEHATTNRWHCAK